MTTRDSITALVLTAHTYTAGTPQMDDDYVKVGNTTYIHTTTTTRVENPNADANTTENVMAISDATLVNGANKNAILTRLAEYYFHNYEFSGDVTELSVRAGDMCAVNGYGDEIVSGMLTRIDYAFGGRVSAAVTISQAQSLTAVMLTVRYMCNGTQIGSAVYSLPQNTAYELTCPILDKYSGATHAIYLPQTETLTGATGTTEVTINAQYNLAATQSGDTLTINTVDSALQARNTLTVGDDNYGE